MPAGAWSRFLAVYFVVCLPMRAQGAEKSTGADFLRIEPSAQAAAMGGGFGALADDVHALYYNPAGISLVGKTQLTATHAEWIAGLQKEYVAIAFPLGSMGWGIGGTLLHSEETERDDKGRPLSTFMVGDGALTAGIGIRLTERHHLGAAAKFLTRTLYHRSATGYAMDFGYQFRHQSTHGHLWNAGLVIKNVGPDIGFTYKEKLPTEIEASVAYQPSIWLRRPLTVTFGVRSGTFLDGIHALIGVQGSILGRFHLRAGYVASADATEKLRAGFGIDLFEMGHIDFAAVRIGRFNSSLFLSLTLQLGRK